MSEHIPGGDNGTTGLITTVASVAGAGFAFGLARAWNWITGHRQTAADQDRLSSIDRARAIVDAATERNQTRLEARCVAAEERAEIWERRARRADQCAHDLRHSYVNELQRQSIERVVPRIPLLEDPFAD